MHHLLQTYVAKAFNLARLSESAEEDGEPAWRQKAIKEPSEEGGRDWSVSRKGNWVCGTCKTTYDPQKDKAAKGSERPRTPERPAVPREDQPLEEYSYYEEEEESFSVQSDSHVEVREETVEESRDREDKVPVATSKAAAKAKVLAQARQLREEADADWDWLDEDDEADEWGPEEETATYDPTVDPSERDSIPDFDPVVGRPVPPGRGRGNPAGPPGPPPRPEQPQVPQVVGPRIPVVDEPTAATQTTPVRSPIRPGSTASRTPSETWDERKGPYPGVKWRGGKPPDPPKYEHNPRDLRSFPRWERKVRL